MCDFVLLLLIKLGLQSSQLLTSRLDLAIISCLFHVWCFLSSLKGDRCDVSPGVLVGMSRKRSRGAWNTCDKMPQLGIHVLLPYVNIIQVGVHPLELSLYTFELILYPFKAGVVLPSQDT